MVASTTGKKTKKTTKIKLPSEWFLPLSVKNELHTTVKQPITVLVIGAGGTGSQVLQHLARIHMGIRARNRGGLHVVVRDDDQVTEANLGRQLFSACDIGRYKADVLIDRINRFYGCRWESVPTRIDETEINQGDCTANIIITCTDNTASRKLMHENVIKIQPHVGKGYHPGYKNHYWIDTGNTKTTGQVILSRYRDLPTVIDLYPNIEALASDDPTPSCSLAEALDRQHLFVNTMIAQVCSLLVWDICTEPEIKWYGAYVNLEGNIMINKRIGRENKNQIQGGESGGRDDNSSETKGTGKRSKRAVAGAV